MRHGNLLCGQRQVASRKLQEGSPVAGARGSPLLLAFSCSS
ncbi:hypothetical protein C4K39_5343 [Pseudomonas sessilinigenes]|nr:hypothetical protein C4K40_3614 [Pseudomonas sp. CMR5c]AZC26987.1 hypothetical protein C4K39_5343 [Pseudomonas sessilinigenes]